MTEIATEARFVRQMVQERVGGFFRNTYSPDAPGVCRVCRGPANDSSDTCGLCLAHRDNFGSLLADRTILLTYAQGQHPDSKHQSAHEMRAYKARFPVQRCLENLELVVGAAVLLHHRCIGEWLGSRWDSLSFVPSARRFGRAHPVSSLANAVLQDGTDPPIQPRKFLLELGPGANVDHDLVEDRFIVPDRFRSAVDGKNVLIVDDTWTTGASIQGASIAAKQAGAHTVTALNVARWLRWDWANQKRILQTLTTPYDPLACPVRGTMCTPAASFRGSWPSSR